ncbi:FAD/NAD-binding domain-containing protein [Mycena latifolia]|nr:FAD/NAD-binding domain-containing protein [Mycena latifolia]
MLKLNKESQTMCHRLIESAFRILVSKSGVVTTLCGHKYRSVDPAVMETNQFSKCKHHRIFIELEDTFNAHGFKHKPGACFRFAQDDVDYFTDFSTLGPGRTTWNVVRSEADDLFRHAASQSVQVSEDCRVESLDFDADGDPSLARPIRANWTRKSGQSGTIEFDWLIDASGRQALRNVVVYGFWTDVAIFDEGGPRSDAPFLECLSDKLGCARLIPLHSGTTSIGVVMPHDNSVSKKKERGSLEEHYKEQLRLAPEIMGLVGTKGAYGAGSCKSVGDYSYHAPSNTGNHFRLHHRPFSSGFHMALTSALSAASTIMASINGESWHTTKIGVCQTRFLMVAFIAYRQMHSNPAMFGALKAENYGQAYDLFCPVYQGENTSPDLSKEDELSGLIYNFPPLVTAEEHAPAKPEYLVDFRELNMLLDSEESDARDVMRRLKLSVLRKDTSADTSDNKWLCHPIGEGSERDVC